MELIDKVREIVIEACKNSSFSREDYETHTGVVERLSFKLAKELKADEEIVHLSALLHDIGRITKLGEKDHEKTSAEETEKILNELNVDKNIISKVKECILAHRHSDPTIPELLEARILKIADAWAHFINPIGMVCFRVKLDHGINEAVKWAKDEKLKRDLDFLERMNKEMDIKNVVADCKRRYECFILLSEE